MSGRGGGGSAAWTTCPLCRWDVHNSARGWQVHFEGCPGYRHYCRFCGKDWYQVDPTDGAIYRHDPLKMAGVKTQQGQMRHAVRGLNVAMTRGLWLPFAALLDRLFGQLADLRKKA